MVAAFMLCPLVALLGPAGPQEPLARARALRGIEQELGVWVEPGLTAWAASLPGLLGGLEVLYLGAHVPATVGLLVWAWLERPGRFALLRDAFLATQLLVVAGYVLAPTAPPWMLERPWEIAAASGSLVSAVQSPFAAFPSGHVAFATFVGGGLALLVRQRWLRGLALAYPVLVTAVVVLTGNHFLLDAAGGALVALLGTALAFAARVALPRWSVRFVGGRVPG